MSVDREALVRIAKYAPGQPPPVPGSEWDDWWRWFVAQLPAIIAALERAERVEAAARELYEFYGDDADAILGPELCAALAPAPVEEGKDD